MKIIPFLLLILLSNCFTIYTKGESVLESQKINSKIQKEKKDMYVLTHKLSKEGLYLLLDGYEVEEENQVSFIKEKYKENKGAKVKTVFEKDIGSCGDIHICGATLVIGISILILEMSTLPFRTMSEPKERIKEEIKTMKSNKLGILSTENISISLFERREYKKYPFKEDKIFIPISELNLNSFNVNRIQYNLFHSNDGKIIREGYLDLSEEVKQNKEVESIIKENDAKNPSVKCISEFPIFAKKDLEGNTAEYEAREICKSKYAKPNVFIWNNKEYNECLDSIKNCYVITRPLKE